MKKIVLSLLLLCSFVFAQTGLYVEAYDEQIHNNRQITLRLRAVNSTNETFNNVRLTYYMPIEENRTVNVQPYYVPSATVSHEVVGNQVEIHIDFATLAPGVFPNNSGMSIGINYTDWQSFDKTASQSYPNSSTFTADDNIAIFIDGEPYNYVDPILTNPGAPRFVGVQPEISTHRSAWVEISNFDNANSSLQGFTVRDANNHSVELSGELPFGQKLIICNTAAVACPTADVTIVPADLEFGLDGELVIYNAENHPVDYVAWGVKGPNASAVAAANADLNTNEYLATHFEDFEIAGNYYSVGDFYRAIVSETQNTVKEWRLFSAKEIEKNIDDLPDPKPLTLSDGSIVTLFEGENMVFSWVAVKNAKKYILTVIDDATNQQVAQVSTALTSASVFLQPGVYRWTVQASQKGDFETSLEALLAHKDELTQITIRTRVYSDQNIYDLHVDPLAARKDTYLMDLQWGYTFNEMKGGTPHNLTAYYDEFHQLQFIDQAEKKVDEEERWRCWIVGATMLNHYYGGNITQDEIKMHVKGDPTNMILHAFPHDYGGSGSWDDADEALSYALNVSQADLNFQMGRPDESYLIDALSQGRPIYFRQYNHIMVIDAVRLTEDQGAYEFRFINTDNNGTYQWRVFENEAYILASWIPSNVTSAQNSDPRILNDEDGDGLYDYDEEVRFLTEVNDPDTDDDEVNDREEILSYTLRQTTCDWAYNPAEHYFYPFITQETFADADGDGLRAEKDFDSDNGGAKDGDEDLNHNGILEEGETDPFVADDDPSTQIQPSFTFPGLYAISSLVYREDVNCTKVDGGYCDLASAGIQSNAYNQLIVEPNNSVGDLHTPGTILFRNLWHGGVDIFGNINFYGDNASVSNESTPYWYLRGGEVIQHTMGDFNEKFPTTFDLPDYQNAADLILDYRTPTATLVPGESYRMIKVSSGTTLHIPAGEFWANDIYLDDGGHIVFDAPNSHSVLHVNGNISWHSTFDHSEAELTQIAAHFELIIHTHNRDYFIDRTFAGRIVAPYSSVHVGQTTNTFYGSVIAYNLELFRFANIKVVPFVY